MWIILTQSVNIIPGSISYEKSSFYRFYGYLHFFLTEHIVDTDTTYV